MIKLYLLQTDTFLPTGYQTITTFCLTLSIVYGKKLQRNLLKLFCHGSIKNIVHLPTGYEFHAQYFSVQYDHTLINEERHLITKEEASKLFGDGLDGYGVIEEKL